MKNLFGNSNLFSVAICPPQPVIAEVAILKNELANPIGWYKSKNSAAHITIISFRTDEYGIETLKEYLKKFANSQSSFTVVFNITGSLGKSFCLTPDESSNAKLMSLMKHFHNNSPKFKRDCFYQPHISIGRNLEEEQIQIASRLIRNVYLKFECDNISLREFNPVKQQFDIREKFIFNA